MNTYKLLIEPKSPFVTPWQSDTIFGHLAWAVAYDQGEQRLTEILQEFNSREPPFLLSAAFPENTLPIPTLPGLTQAEMQELLNWVMENKDSLPEPLGQELKSILDRSAADRIAVKRWLVEQVKKANEVEYMDIHAFRELGDGLSSLTLTRFLITHPQPRYTRKEVVMRTAVDRITGTAKEGKLFELEETFYGYDNGGRSHPVRLCIWLKLRDASWKSDIHRWFKIVERAGFGKRKSTGLGQFRVVGEIAGTELPSPPNANAFLTLSSYVPRVTDSYQGYYRYIVKRGKLGGHWALGGTIWKTPLLMFVPGSVFYTSAGPAEYYGGLVLVLDRQGTAIYQYAYAFPISIRLSQPGGKL